MQASSANPMRVRQNIFFMLRLVSCSDPNFCFVHSSSSTQIFSFACRNVGKAALWSSWQNWCRLSKTKSPCHPEPKSCVESCPHKAMGFQKLCHHSVTQMKWQGKLQLSSPPDKIAPHCSQASCCLEMGQHHCLWEPKRCQETGMTPRNRALIAQKSQVGNV